MPACVALAISLPADRLCAQDDVDIDHLNALSVAGRWAELRAELAMLDQRRDTLSVDDRLQMDLIRARMLALDNRPDEAIDALAEALNPPQPAERLAIRLRALQLATNILVFYERFQEAFRYYREALSLAPEVDDPNLRAVTWIVASDLHTRVGEYATALDYAERALTEAGASGVMRTRCVALYQRGLAYTGLGQAAEARDDLLRAASICRTIPDPIYAGQALVALAELPDTAPADRQRRLQEATDLFRQARYLEGELKSRALLASLAVHEGNLALATQWLEPVMDWIPEPGNHESRARALEVAALLARRQGDLERAYELTLQARAQLRRHVNSLREMQLTLLLSALNEQDKARELALLRSREQTARLALANQRRDTVVAYWLAASAVAVLLLLILLVMRSFREHRDLRRQAEPDSLTGLYTHTQFFELARRQFERTRAEDEPFVLVLADIDLFKQVNDEYGHLMGDEVLRRVGARFREAFGESALIGRTGGEEFAVALPRSTLDDALAMIGKLREHLNRRRHDEREPAITLSFGVAARQREKSLDHLFSRADQALYDAKEGGRNRIVVAPLDPGQLAPAMLT
ncbi:MAG: GGDEF domain-containing protein [Wenzhouxiangellaceae bacterium]